MPVLEGADHGVEVHHAGILADADIRIVAPDELPQAGQALEPVDDDVLPAEILQRERFAGGKRVVGGHHGIPPLDDERHEDPPGGMRPGTVVILDDIKGAPVQVVEELVLGFHNRLLDDIRVFLEEGPAEARKQVRLEADDGADADAVVDGVGFPAAGEQQVDIRADFEDAVEEGFARGGEADAGDAALEEFEADIRLQPVDLLLQGRGREEQGFRRGVEAVVLRQGDEGFHVFGVHARSPAERYGRTGGKRFSFSLLYRNSSVKASKICI